MPETIAVVTPVQRVRLHNVTWQLYEHLLAEQVDAAGTRIAYDRGELEIMVVNSEHEYLNRTISRIVDAAAMALRVPCYPAGSTTFKRDDRFQGFEPDSSFYIQNVRAVRDRRRIDLAMDPPPDLVIEIDITSDSMNRFPIFAGVGVREVWRYSKGMIEFHALRNGIYSVVSASEVLRPLTAAMVTRFVNECNPEELSAWFASIQRWVQEHR